jgi:hypothetical protein
MNEFPLSTHKWLELGCPKDVWFTIVRDEALKHVDMDTPKRLEQLIKWFLEDHGKYELRKIPHTVAEHFTDVYIHNNVFTMARSEGIINGESVPVVAMGVEARIVK